MKPFTVCAIMWIAVSLGVVTGLYFTKDANCLWTFLLPALVSSDFKIKD